MENGRSYEDPVVCGESEKGDNSTALYLHGGNSITVVIVGPVFNY